MNEFFEHPIALTVLLLASGLLIAWLSTRFMELANNTALASLVFLPAILYVVLSGAVTDITGLGFSAKFKDQAQKSVASLLLAHGISQSPDLVIRDNLADNPDFARDAIFSTCRPYLIFKPETLPKRDASNQEKIERLILVAGAIRSSVACGELRALVFLDQHDHPTKFFESYFFYDLLPIEIVPLDDERPQRVLNAVLATELSGIFLNPDYVTHTHARKVFVNEGATLVEALREFQNSNGNVAVVTNAAGQFRGVVSRQHLIETLTLAMSNAALDK